MGRWINTIHVQSTDAVVVGHLVAVVFVAAPLVYAAISKLMAPSAFLMALPQFHSDLPARPATARAVGLFELAAAGALILMVRWESAVVCTVAYVAFGLVVERARRLGASGDCGCFGSLESRIDGLAVVRNIALGLAALLIAFGRGMGLLPNYDASTALPVALSTLLAAAALDTFVSVRRTIRR